MLNGTMSQSEVEANTYNQCQMRENAYEQGRIGFGLGSPLVEKIVSNFANQSSRVQ